MATGVHSLLFNFGKQGRQHLPVVISDEVNKISFRVLQAVGVWDYERESTVYQAEVVPFEGMDDCNPENVAKPLNEIDTNFRFVFMKLSHQAEEKWSKRGSNDVMRGNYIHHKNLLRCVYWFRNINGITATVLFDSGVPSIRSLMLSSDLFRVSGIPQKCIAVALKSAVKGLNHLHSRFGQCHRQISAGNIYLFNSLDTIKLSFAASAFERTDSGHLSAVDGQSSTTFMPMGDILLWAKAPEVVIDRKMSYGLSHYTTKSDIWLIGVAALELAYGNIRVASADQFLDVASFISEERKMNDNWNELLKDAEKYKLVKAKGKRKMFDKAADKLASQLKIGGKNVEDGARHFSKQFVKFVGMCLREEPEDRPTAQELLDCQFLKNVDYIRYFKEIMMN